MIVSSSENSLVVDASVVNVKSSSLILAGNSGANLRGKREGGEGKEGRERREERGAPFCSYHLYYNR